MKNWEDLTDAELDQRKKKSKLAWENLSDEQKENITSAANKAVRVSSKVGSKLEKYLLNLLIKDGFNVEFHKEQSILNTKLQIDLFIPKLNVAIEIDGPSHFEPVWGDDSLKRNQKYDNKKTGLIIGKGLFLIRIKQTKDFSKSRGLLIFQELQKILQDIGSNNITHNKVLTIGD
jgi:very-short-patch-repair endonuclease